MYKISFTVVILISAVIINCNHSPTGPDEHKVNEILPTLKKHCYIIGFEINGKIAGIGSGFAVSDRKIMSNAHLIEALVEFAEKYGLSNNKIVAVRDGGWINNKYSFELDSFSIHPEYDPNIQFTFDFGLSSNAEVR